MRLKNVKLKSKTQTDFGFVNFDCPSRWTLEWRPDLRFVLVSSPDRPGELMGLTPDSIASFTVDEAELK